MSAGTSVPEQAARLVERAQKVALCLDFDGTLSPIVEDPQAATPAAPNTTPTPTASPAAAMRRNFRPCPARCAGS